MDTGKDLSASPDDVWRLVHRKEYEQQLTIEEIRIGQVLRVDLKNNFLDKTGFVVDINNNSIDLTATAGPKMSENLKIQLDNIKSVVEICSSPLFHRIKRIVDGKQAKGGGVPNIVWEKDDNTQGRDVDISRRPKMHLSSPVRTKYRRV